MCDAIDVSSSYGFVSHDSNNHAISFSALQIENASFLSMHYQFYDSLRRCSRTFSIPNRPKRGEIQFNDFNHLILFSFLSFDAMQMMWYQNSFLLDPTDRRSMQSKGDRYTLIIRNFQTSDFGNYRYVPSLPFQCSPDPPQNDKHSIFILLFRASCVADNALGRTKKYIEISGRPGPAEFISPMFSGSQEYYNLTWSVESIPPLEEIRLLYRRLMVSDQVIIKRSHLFH